MRAVAVIATLLSGDVTPYHSHRFPVTVYMLEGSFTLEVRADGCEPVKRAWTSPAAGETGRVEMTLTPRAAGALVLRLDPDAVLPVPPVLVIGLGGGRTVHARLAADGTFVAEPVPAGRHRLAFEDRHWYYRAEPREIELAPGERKRLVLPVKASGKLAVLVRTPDGRTDMVVPCDVKRADGGPLGRVAFRKKEGLRSMSTQGTLPGLRGPATVDQQLAPGTYVVRIEPKGFAPREQRVEVKAGETALATFELER